MVIISIEHSMEVILCLENVIKQGKRNQEIS